MLTQPPNPFIRCANNVATDYTDWHGEKQCI